MAGLGDATARVATVLGVAEVEAIGGFDPTTETVEALEGVDGPGVGASLRLCERGFGGGGTGVEVDAVGAGCGGRGALAFE